VNKERRKRIQEIVDNLEEIKGRIDEIQEEERECYDNLSEGLQQTERGQGYEASADALSDAECNVDDVISALEVAME
jgi:hypothetical protein